jgi:phospholipid/cholesterol/gamma-HCH transport system substrate-binding protein
MKSTATAVKFAAFAAVMLMVLFALVVVFGQMRFGPTNVYTARFTSASGLRPGEVVRIAGVDVGRVKDVKVVDGHSADVRFSVDSSVPVTKATRALVRYQNLIGDRFLELKEGEGAVTPLADGTFIPVTNTSPALDLDALVGGFRPLLKAVNSQQVNALSESLVQVLQGQGGSIEAILAQTADFTNGLADQDKLIGSVITNLNQVLGIFEKRNAEFDTGVDQLSQLIKGLAADSPGFANSVAGISNASRSVASLLNQSNADISQNIVELGRVSRVVNNDSAYVDRLLGELPESYQKLSRLGLYGSFFTFYLCDATLKLNGPAGNPVYINIVGQRAGRCAPL